MMTSEPFTDATMLGARVIKALDKTEFVLSPDDGSIDNVTDGSVTASVELIDGDSDLALLELISTVELPLKDEESRLGADPREDADPSIPESNTSVGSPRKLDVVAPAVF